MANKNVYDFKTEKRKINQKSVKKGIQKKGRIKRMGLSPFPLIVISVVFAVCIFFAYKEALKGPSGPTISSGITPSAELVVTGQWINYDNPSEPIKRDPIWVMYQNLPDADKNVYSLFLDLIEKRQGKDYRSMVEVSDKTLASIGKDHLWEVLYAVLYDHPEYFFMLTNRSKIDCRTLTKGGITTYYYYIEEDTPLEKQQIETLKQAGELFLSDIDMSASDQDIEIQIHDKLIGMVSYNMELFESDFSVDKGWDLGHTAYGALVADSEGRPNYAVCSGYSFAFEYLMHEAGIPCGVISGQARRLDDSNDAPGDHGWNAVYIDGKWYETDVTWDDFDYPQEKDVTGVISSALQNNETVRFNICHHFYNKTTKEMEYLPATEDTVLNIEGYEPFNLRESTVHIRNSVVSTDDETSVFLNSLVPLAE